MDAKKRPSEQDILWGGLLPVKSRRRVDPGAYHTRIVAPRM